VEDVWITPYENGHLQAVGTDDAGRRQYLYHPQWRERRDAEKYDRMLLFGKALAKARRRVILDLGREGMPLERACAAAVRLLDLGYFRIGNDVYAADNGSLRPHHPGAAARAAAPGRAGASGSRASPASSTSSRSTTRSSSRRSR
jgi:DNA topoisomerase IB